MFEFQTQLIFPTHAVSRAGALPKGAERLSLKAGGDTLSGVHLPADQNGAGSPTLILGFAGNAWNSQDAATYLHELYPDEDVVVFHYRGYAPSTGSPSAEALMADAPLVYDFAVQSLKPKRAVAVGFSIGTGVAANLAHQRPVDGVILVTPFDSLKAVAQSMYPWLPIGPFFQHEIDAASPLEKSKVPVAIVAAEHDELIPTMRTDALRKRVRTLAFDRAISGAGHNDIYARSEFQAAMREALGAVTR
jgi:pimeloyl-ACP methyl ester carboxylesterase